MCAGKFLNSDGLRRFSTMSKRLVGSYKLDSQQVLLAGQDGYVYIMIDFEVCNLESASARNDQGLIDRNRYFNGSK